MIDLNQHEPAIVFTVAVVTIKLGPAAIVTGKFSHFVIRDLEHLVGLQVVRLAVPLEDLCRGVLLRIVPQSHRIADRRWLAHRFKFRPVPAFPDHQPGNPRKQDDKTGHQALRPALARKTIIDGQAHRVTSVGCRVPGVE